MLLLRIYENRAHNVVRSIIPLTLNIFQSENIFSYFSDRYFLIFSVISIQLHSPPGITSTQFKC